MFNRFAEKPNISECLHFIHLLLGFLGYWIMYPVLVGIAFEVMALYFNDFNRPELPAFAFFIAIWMITMVRYWQRVQVKKFIISFLKCLLCFL